MSKITNDDLTRSGIAQNALQLYPIPIWQQWASKG